MRLAAASQPVLLPRAGVASAKGPSASVTGEMESLLAWMKEVFAHISNQKVGSKHTPWFIQLGFYSLVLITWFW